MAAAVYSDVVFGLGYMVGVSSILAFPLAVAVGLLRRWPDARRRELALLLSLTAFASGGAITVLRHGYQTGMDRRHTRHLEYAKFRRALRKDHTFDEVELYVSPKDIFWMRGSVCTEADLVRLESLAARCRLIRWNGNVVVKGRPAQE